MQLMELLDADGIDYEKLSYLFDFKSPLRRNTDADKPWVNTATAFKCRALMSCLTEEDPDEFALSMYQKGDEIQQYGTGHFTGDECLSGDALIQGSECCSVAEMMYSCETLLSIAAIRSGAICWSVRRSTPCLQRRRRICGRISTFR